MSHIKEVIYLKTEQIKEMEDSMHDFLIGRAVEIISDYNGQPCGTSKPSLKGKTGEIVGVNINGTACSVWIEGYYFGHPALHIDEIEFLEEKDPPLANK